MASTIGTPSRLSRCRSRRVREPPPRGVVADFHVSSSADIVFDQPDIALLRG